MSSVMSVGIVMAGQLASLWWDGVVSGRTLCGVCCCMLCIFWAKYWHLEEMFVSMVLVRFEWKIFGVLMGIRLLLRREKGTCVVCGSEQGMCKCTWSVTN